MPKNFIPNGPIPGANYTSDTKNYPWHREPEITELDRGIETVMKQLSSKKGAYGMLNALQAGVTVVQYTSMLLMSGIGKGLWTPDFALLLAGPSAKMMDIMAKDAGIKYVLGLDDLPEKTISYFQRQADISNQDVSSAVNELKSSDIPTDNVSQPSINPPEDEGNGFMKRPASIEAMAEDGPPSLAPDINEPV